MRRQRAQPSLAAARATPVHSTHRSAHRHDAVRALTWDGFARRKPSARLDWMYEGPAVASSEEYLLGKRVEPHHLDAATSEQTPVRPAPSARRPCSH